MSYPAGVDFAEFRSRALTEGLRYGEDRMVFLRELAQNARDASATRIGVSAFVEGSDAVVGFGDDGEGMEYEHARRFLFTLYASSKEKDSRSAGRFGVGFWSVLLFKPHRILIESMTEAGDAWAVALDGELAEPRRIPCGLSTPGTRVTLRRTAQPKEAERLLVEIERALTRYCRYLRRNDRRGSPLPVHLNGKRVDEQINIDGPCWLAFRDGSVEGAVGLGERPRVELYARGLLVWRGTTLDELRYGAPPVDEVAHPEGLAPVYVINGNQLSVTLERRAVVDDRALARLRRVARRRMRELVGRYLDGVSPRPPLERFADWISGLIEDLRLGSRLGPIAFMTALVFALAGTGAFVFHARFGDESGPARGDATSGGGAGAGGVLPGLGAPAVPVDVRLGDAAEFIGPMVHPLGVAPRIPLEYTPPEPMLFRTRAVETLHAGRGIVATPPVSAMVAAGYRCAASCVKVEVAVDADPGFLVLPTPTGHRVESGSVWLGGRLVDRVLTTEGGEPALRVDKPIKGLISYRTGPGSSYLEPTRRELLLDVPDGLVGSNSSRHSVAATATSKTR
ncbi:MAG: ATP-binding protein [Deltaproteobacteria bacterium]|nr:ATP-binding protein [Deltaproteobacteria bacterium]